MLCRECASNGRSPLFQVQPGLLALSIVACLGVASLGGWILFSNMLGYFGLMLAFLLGIGVAETALRITGRKRGTKMEAVAGACTAIGMLASGLVVSPMFFSLWPVLMVVVATVSAVNRIRYI
jgi:hypothetical protein